MTVPNATVRRSSITRPHPPSPAASAPGATFDFYGCSWPALGPCTGYRRGAAVSRNRDSPPRSETPRRGEPAGRLSGPWVGVCAGSTPGRAEDRRQSAVDESEMKARAGSAPGPLEADSGAFTEAAVRRAWPRTLTLEHPNRMSRPFRLRYAGRALRRNQRQATRLGIPGRRTLSPFGGVADRKALRRGLEARSRTSGPAQVALVRDPEPVKPCPRPWVGLHSFLAPVPNRDRVRESANVVGQGR